MDSFDLGRYRQRERQRKACPGLFQLQHSFSIQACFDSCCRKGPFFISGAGTAARSIPQGLPELSQETINSESDWREP